MAERDATIRSDRDRDMDSAIGLCPGRCRSIPTDCRCSVNSIVAFAVMTSGPTTSTRSSCLDKDRTVQAGSGARPKQKSTRDRATRNREVLPYGSTTCKSVPSILAVNIRVEKTDFNNSLANRRSGFLASDGEKGNACRREKKNRWLNHCFDLVGRYLSSIFSG